MVNRLATSNEEDEVFHLSYSIMSYINKGGVYQDRDIARGWCSSQKLRREENMHG